MRTTQLQLSDDRWLRADGIATHTVAARGAMRLYVARLENRGRRSVLPRGGQLPATDWSACDDLRSCLRDRFARRFHLGL